MNKPKLSGKNVKCKNYWNLKRNFCYGIYFSKIHAICKGKFQKCDHIYLAIHSHSALIFRLLCILIARKKIQHLREELQHMTIVRIFIYLSLKYNSYFHNILCFFINTNAATSFLTLYWLLLLSPARNYLICNPCLPQCVCVCG